MRQIILDTETTGLSPQQGHRIIEIGCVELINRRPTGKTFHTYLQPDRAIDAGATQVHGITNEFLKDSPRFHEIAPEFKNFIRGAELIIHNAPFDVGFIQNEFLLMKDTDWQTLSQHCPIIDTLALARQKHPGQKNSLDALCNRYHVDNQHREKHGALLDAYILADVYLLMTGGQEVLSLEEGASPSQEMVFEDRVETTDLPLLEATEPEIEAHNAFIANMEKKYQITSLWRGIEESVKLETII